MKEKKIVEFLEGIFSFLSSWKMPVLSHLVSGLAKSYIVESLKKINIEPVEELVQLYAWRNGVNADAGIPLDDIQFIPGFHLLSLEHAVKQYAAIKDDKRWDTNWFPFMANGGGDFYALDTNSNSLSIVGFILGESEQDVEYLNLTSMMKTFYDCFEAGVVFKTKEGYLEMDDDEHAEIAYRNNPEVDFWS